MKNVYIVKSVYEIEKENVKGKEPYSQVVVFSTMKKAKEYFRFLVDSMLRQRENDLKIYKYDNYFNYNLSYSFVENGWTYKCYNYIEEKKVD